MVLGSRHNQAMIYLASQSPRRRQLLEQLGVSYDLLLPGDEEDAEGIEVVLPGEAPLAYVKRVTHLKLQAALQRCKARGLKAAPVLCSCLLYTSPSPRDYAASRMPSSA